MIKKIPFSQFMKDCSKIIIGTSIISTLDQLNDIIKYAEGTYGKQILNNNTIVVYDKNLYDKIKKHKNMFFPQAKIIDKKETAEFLGNIFYKKIEKPFNVYEINQIFIYKDITDAILEHQNDDILIFE